MIIRRAWFRILLLALFTFMLGFSYNYHLPKIEAFLLTEAERLSESHAPVRIWAKQLHFHLFPLGIVLEDVRLLPKAPVDRYLAPAKLKEIGARLAILPLLRGEIRLAQVFIRDSELSLFLREDLFKSQGGKKLAFDFNLLYSLPIDELSLENVRIQGRIAPNNIVFRVDDLNLAIENRYRSLFVELRTPEVMIKPSGQVVPLKAQLELRTLVEAEEAQVSAFKLRLNDSFVVASGRFNGDFSAGQVSNGALDARAKLQLVDLNTWEKVFFNPGKLPVFNGTAELDLGVEIRDGKGYRFEADLNTGALAIGKFKIGTVQTSLSTDLKSVKSDSIVVDNSSGSIRIEKVNVQLSPLAFTASAITEKVDLRRFLENLGIKGVPVELKIDGRADCRGTASDLFDIRCSAKISSNRLHVTTRSGKNTIVDTSELNARGEVQITKKEVSYSALLGIGKGSTGSSNGVINYDRGFKINYTGDQVDFSDVKGIAGLKVEGLAKITGQTQGTSKWATIALHADGKDVWLQDYPLGEISTDVTYKAGQLGFEKLSGQYGVSRFHGRVGVDLEADRLKVSAQIPFADLNDVQNIFQRHFTLPVRALGTGTAQLEAEGPFNFRLMSYQLRSNFFRGELAKETFDQLVFNVTSKDGLVKSDRIYITKSSGVAEVKGQITPGGEIDTVVVARGVRLEQSENVLALGLDLQGLTDVTMLIRGQLPKPRIELNGRLSKVVLADVAAEDSIFKLNFLPDRLEGSGEFLGTTLVSSFSFPYVPSAPFSFKLKTHKWDFTTLFSLVSRSARRLDFATSVSMDVNLQAEQGGFWNASGQMQVDEFILRKGGKQMTAEKAMYLTMRQGVINSDSFNITSGDSYLKLDMVGLTKDKLNASLNGKVDLSLLGLFTPFISDLRGYSSLSVDIGGSLVKPTVSGSAYIDKGYAKFSEFYHPFSNVRADLLFNDNQILINAVRADLAGGKLAGDGKITFAGNSRPISVQGTFNDVKLNFPDRFHTNGSGTVKIQGDRFPYIMNIDYLVNGGEVTFEIGEEGEDDNTIKASAYLPRFLNADTFHPFFFDVNVKLANPVLFNNSLVRSSVSGQVTAKGTPDRLSLNGTLTPAPGGKVFFNDQPFEISSAYVEYTDSAPNDPKIYLTATARVTDTVQDDQQRTTEVQYDVSLLVQGRGRDPQITLSSQPPLSQREIVSLLALGMTTSGMDEGRSSDFKAANTSTAIGAALLQRAGSRRLKDTLGLDVKVSSSQPTPDNASTPKVTLSKQWTPKFGASASSTLQANPTNDVKLEYKMNKNISVIGSWEGRETNPEKDDPTENVFGLDLEYKVQFK